jgi:putative oxidoreductase
MRKLAFLAFLQPFGDFTLLLLRIFAGLFLVLSVWDNLTSGERMREFAEFLANHGFSSPRLLAPVSVYLQLLVGLAFVLGLFTRWAGILCVIHFAIAIAMVDRMTGMRGTFPSACLIFIGLFLATHGAGRFSIDAALRGNEAPRSTGSVRLRK